METRTTLADEPSAAADRASRSTPTPARIKVGSATVEVCDVGLRTIAVILLAGLAGWLIFRAVTTRRVPWISLGLVALVLVPLLVTERQWVSAEKEFSSVAKSYQPISQGVHCQRLGESFTYAGSELGHVAYDENGMPDGPAFLSYDTCNALAAYWRASSSEKSHPTREEIIAVHVLTHEAMHLSGVKQESLAECDAMQRDTKTAQELGASPAQARLVAEVYAEQVYPDMSADYRDADCTKGGPWDKTPADGEWP